MRACLHRHGLASRISASGYASYCGKSASTFCKLIEENARLSRSGSPSKKTGPACNSLRKPNADTLISSIDKAKGVESKLLTGKKSLWCSFGLKNKSLSEPTFSLGQATSKQGDDLTDKQTALPARDNFSKVKEGVLALESKPRLKLNGIDIKLFSGKQRQNLSR